MNNKQLLLLTLITYSHTVFYAKAALEVQDPATRTYKLSKSSFFRSTDFCPLTDAYASTNLQNIVIVGKSQNIKGFIFHLKNSPFSGLMETLFPEITNYQENYRTHIAAIGAILTHPLFAGEDRITILDSFLTNLYMPQPSFDGRDPFCYLKLERFLINQNPEITDFIKNIADLQEEYLTQLMAAGVNTGSLDRYKKYFDKDRKEANALRKELQEPSLKRTSLDENDTSKRPAISNDTEETSVTAEPSFFELSDDLKKMMEKHPEKFTSSHSHSVAGSSALIQQ